jgi:hypothetical protein
MIKSPVVVLSQNNPKNLFKCLDSLKNQIEDREVFFFIDGPRTREDQMLIQQSINLCQSKIPNMKINASQQYISYPNLLKRAKESVYETNETAIFVSENSVLNNYYLNQLDDLYSKLKEVGNIGIVNLYSGEDMDLEEQELNYNKLVPCMNNISYLMPRDSYDIIFNDLQDYFKILAQHNGVVPVRQVRYEWSKFGVGDRVTGTIEDAITVYMLKNGLNKISTFTNNLEIIESGVSNVFNRKVSDYEISESKLNLIKKDLESYYFSDKDYRDFEVKLG